MKIRTSSKSQDSNTEPPNSKSLDSPLHTKPIIHTIQIISNISKAKSKSLPNSTHKNSKFSTHSATTPSPTKRRRISKDAAAASPEFYKIISPKPFTSPYLLRKSSPSPTKRIFPNASTHNMPIPAAAASHWDGMGFDMSDVEKYHQKMEAGEKKALKREHELYVYQMHLQQLKNQ